MATTDRPTGSVATAAAYVKSLPHPDAAEFAPIRGELARLYIRHKAELKMGDWSDEQIAAQVSDINRRPGRLLDGRDGA
jgi:hypothetical protein